MMTWMMDDLYGKMKRETAGGSRPGNPAAGVRRFVRECRKGGMAKEDAIRAAENRYRYLPTEAQIIVNEFWN